MYGERDRSKFQFDRTFRRLVLHTLKYSVILIPSVFGTIAGVIFGVAWLFATYGTAMGTVSLLGLVVAALLVALSFKLAQGYVRDLERKEDELMRHLQREARY